MNPIAHISIKLPADNYRWGFIPISRKPMWREIARRIADEHGITVRDMLSESRFQTYAHARQHLMAELHASGRGYAPIGRLLGMDHTTVMYGVKAHKARTA